MLWTSTLQMSELSILSPPSTTAWSMASSCLAHSLAVSLDIAVLFVRSLVMVVAAWGLKFCAGISSCNGVGGVLRRGLSIHRVGGVDVMEVCNYHVLLSNAVIMVIWGSVKYMHNLSKRQKYLVVKKF